VGSRISRCQRRQGYPFEQSSVAVVSAGGARCVAQWKGGTAGREIENTRSVGKIDVWIVLIVEFPTKTDAVAAQCASGVVLHLRDLGDAASGLPGGIA